MTRSQKPQQAALRGEVLATYSTGPITAVTVHRDRDVVHLAPVWRRRRPLQLDRRAWVNLFRDDAVLAAALFLEVPRQQLLGRLCPRCLAGEACE